MSNDPDDRFYRDGRFFGAARVTGSHDNHVMIASTTIIATALSDAWVANHTRLAG